MSDQKVTTDLVALLDGALRSYGGALKRTRPEPRVQEVGRVISVAEGVARVNGLGNVGYEELIRFEGGAYGLAFNLDPEVVAVVLLDSNQTVRAGTEASRTGRVLDVPVGSQLIGRVVDPLGRPLDDKGEIKTRERRPAERVAPPIMDRAPVTVPLQTGVQAVDALIPVGRGQRELILGDRQTGKTALAVDAIINQRGTGMISVYCAIGQRSSAVAGVIADLREHGVMDRTIVVVATGEDAPGLNYIAPYAATTMAEYFMDKGEDTLVVYDDLTRHARSYRELSLLLRRPPAREAYPGDIFYIHSRLLERSTHLSEEKSGGSLTALPIIETQEQNISSYIPTNLISITDGQIYLSPKLFQDGVLPPVEVGRSVSRVGGKTQLPAYRSVAGDLRLAYSQFQELENFARFGVQLDESTRQALERGRRVREVLKQPQYQPIPVPEQIAVLVAVTKGVFDGVPLKNIARAKNAVRAGARENLTDLSQRILEQSELSDEDIEQIRQTAQNAVQHEFQDAAQAEGTG